MASENIFRPQNDQEKDLKSGGFKDIRSWRQEDVKQKSAKQIADVGQDFIYKKREPFCRTCAHNAVEEKIDEINKRIKKAITKKEENIDISIDIDFTKFGGFDKFEYVGDSEIMEKPLMATTNSVQIMTGKYKNYMCKECSSQISIQFKTEELEEMPDEKRKLVGEKPKKTAK